MAPIILRSTSAKFVSAVLAETILGRVLYQSWIPTDGTLTSGGGFPLFGRQTVGVPVFPAVRVPVFPGAPLKSKLTEAKARQATRIRELGSALTASGLVTLGEQARALGLSRSSAWAVLKANHKTSGLAAGTINQMLSSQALPPRARVTILTYIEEKRAGLYGHNKTQLRRFAAGLVRARALFAGNVLVATLAWIIVRLVH
jgi:hypothetical protein